MTKEEIRNLSPVERVAGYLLASAKLAAIGAKLRNHKDDADWTEDEEAEWGAAADELDPWWYGMSKEEHDAVEDMTAMFGSITRGEWPLSLD